MLYGVCVCALVFFLLLLNMIHLHIVVFRARLALLTVLSLPFSVPLFHFRLCCVCVNVNPIFTFTFLTLFSFCSPLFYLSLHLTLCSLPEYRIFSLIINYILYEYVYEWCVFFFSFLILLLLMLWYVEKLKLKQYSVTFPDLRWTKSNAAVGSLPEIILMQ